MTIITQITMFYVSRHCIIASPFLLRIAKLFVLGNDIQHHTNKGTQQIAIHRLFTDTDSLTYEIETEDAHKDFWSD